MKTSPIKPNWSAWPMLLAALLQFPAGKTSGQTAPSPSVVSRDEADVKACKVRLNRIREALQQYQAKHNRLPNWLSDLAPEFITDPKVFICPVVDRLGDLRAWRAGIRTDVFTDPVLPTSYSYEFCAKELPLVGAPTTWQEYKKRQMRLVGDRVPVVRCFAHEPILNLPVRGLVYPSGLYWEDEFPQIASHEALTQESVFHDDLTAFLKRPRSYPPRSTDASSRLVDLIGSYNFGLNETVRLERPGESDFANLPQGAVKLERVGIEFDIRGRIQLKGKRMRMPFPPRVDGIKVNQECQRVHFLCGTVYGARTGIEIGRFDVHYVDGPSNRVPIICGKDVQDWWFDPQGRQSGNGVAWAGPNPSSHAQGSWVRLYHMQWDNPRANTRIATLDFVSALTDAAPFLIAITLE